MSTIYKTDLTYTKARERGVKGKASLRSSLQAHEERTQTDPVYRAKLKPPPLPSERGKK